MPHTLLQDLSYKMVCKAPERAAFIDVVKFKANCSVFLVFLVLNYRMVKGIFVLKGKLQGGLQDAGRGRAHHVPE